MTFRAQDKPDEERKWLIEMTETEMALLFAYVCQTCSSMVGHDQMQRNIIAAMFTQCTTVEQIDHTLNLVFKLIKPELYAFVRGVLIAKISLPLDKIALNKVQEMIAKGPLR